MINNNVTWPYISGLIETDGSLHVSLVPSSGQVKPMIKISQKTNNNLLPNIAEFLKRVNINATVDPGEVGGKGRAPALRIQGRGQVLKMLQLLEEHSPLKVNGKTVLFASAKQRDFLITKKLCEENLTMPQKIDLLKSMRKASQDVSDIMVTGMKSRSVYESEFGLTTNSSLNAAKTLLDEVDSIYFEGVNAIEQGISSNSLMVDGNYITGLIDGDGSYYVTFDFKQAKPPKFPNPTVAWQGNFTMTMETNGLLTLKVVKYFFKIENTTLREGKEKTFFQMWIRTQPYMRNIIKHHETYPCLGTYRRQQFELVKKLFYMRDNGQLSNYILVEQFLTDVYVVSEISKKGPARRPLRDTLDKLKLWLNSKK
jgi:hypothetical protein